VLERKLNRWILEQQFIPLREKDIQKIKEGTIGFDIQPMTSIHLHSNIMWELGTNGNIMYVYIFLTVALLILVIACVNFMNLSTARALKRAREVGIRKAIGVQRHQLVVQFLVESLLLTFIAAGLAVLLVEILMPAFNRFSGKELSLTGQLNFAFLLFFVSGTVVIGIIAGSYPAFYLSSFIPYEVIKGTGVKGYSQPTVRKALVVFQFVISIFLIICTFTIFKQLSFLRNRDLGFNKEQVVVLPLKDDRIRSKFEAFRTRLLSEATIVSVAGTSSIPGGQFNQNAVREEGGDEDRMMAETFVTADFFPLLGIETASGRVFSDNFRGDSAASFVINESAARLLGTDSMVNRQVTYYGDVLTNARGTIIGVVKDFNIHSLHQPVKPLIMMLGRNNMLTYVLIRIKPEDTQGTLDFIERTWKQFESEHTFTYTFLDEEFERQYQGEEKMAAIFWIFALLAILIAAMGLFGLSSFMIEQRTKEIGIRKVHGAGIITILLIFIRHFSSWVLIASLVAVPLGLLFAGNWLRNFAYRTHTGAGIFILSVLIAVVIAILTISYQALRAARMDPVDSLKYE
jgi:putative ABC transport system permease protein